MFEDTYKTITGNSEGIFRDRGSKFIARTFPVNSEKEVKECLEEMRKMYSDARHHCYAYILNPDKSAYRVNDDGEPSGTAGKPIYGQLLSFDLTNVLIVVVRYFGGTLLGVSGLINAYRTATRTALENATIIEKTVNDVYKLTYDYSVTSDVMRIIKEFDAQFVEQQFEMKCTLTFSIRKSMSNLIFDALKRVPNTQIDFLKSN
ncbi:MAG: YigZ family protein [Bacteroidales bacterium]|nr:YigZ family protein [Bacteroidales bacterium]